MLREHTTIDYACKIVEMLDSRRGPVPAADIAAGIAASQSYVCKVLSRMSRSELLRSGVEGYELTRPLSRLTLQDILLICHDRQRRGPAERASAKLTELARQIPLADLL